MVVLIRALTVAVVGFVFHKALAAGEKPPCFCVFSDVVYSSDRLSENGPHFLRAIHRCLALENTFWLFRRLVVLSRVE